MLSKIVIENFRSIERAEVELAPIVVLYGPTASGKSSLLYAPLVLKNFIVNPNRSADGYFQLGFMDLGGFDECVFNHEGSRQIGVEVWLEEETPQSQSYKFCLSKRKGAILQKWSELVLECGIPIPYGVNQTFSFNYSENSGGNVYDYVINWNGITCSVAPTNPTSSNQQRAREIAESINAIPEKIKRIDIAPHRRGFFKPNYTSVSVSPTPITEDEVASFIINDQYLAPRISAHTEELFGRDFRIYVPPGTATAFFHTMDKKSRTPGSIVNDGFGVNQVIYLLAKLLRSDVQTLLIEEPEVHLHPTVVRNLARHLCAIVQEDKKQVILTTHSELFVSSLLTMVVEGKLLPEKIRCYLCMKEGRRTQFNAQKVQRNGQIEGGLTTFIEAELEDLQKLLGLRIKE